MADAKIMEHAKQVYNTLCAAIDNIEWHYTKDEEKLLVHFGVNGEKMPMQFFILVDAERKLIRLMSPLPFKMSEDKRIDGVLATCAASFGMAEGNFDYDVTDGSIEFRMTSYFEGCQIGEGFFEFMISCACAMVDEYSDKFLAINKGVLNIIDFITNKD